MGGGGGGGAGDLTNTSTKPLGIHFHVYFNL